jgi:hypothetical protein
MKLVLALLLVGCTVGTAKPPVRGPWLVPAEALDRQDPAADVSHNPVTVRCVGSYSDPGPRSTYEHGGPGAALGAIGIALAMGALAQ